MRETNKSYIVRTKETDIVIDIEEKIEPDPEIVRKVMKILSRGNDVQLRAKKGNQVDVYELKVTKEQ